MDKSPTPSNDDEMIEEQKFENVIPEFEPCSGLGDDGQINSSTTNN